jgi:hypothetical protein
MPTLFVGYFQGPLFFKTNFNSLVQVNFLEISIACMVTNEANVKSKILGLNKNASLYYI